MTRKRYPGKFEGCEDDRLAEVLCSTDCNAQCGEADTTGWYGLILHRNHGYIVSEDSQGFFDYTYYETKEEAEKVFGRIESDIQEDAGPQPEDICIESNGFHYSVGIIEGKHIGEYADYADAKNAAREWMKENQFWPNVWFVSDHGNASIITIPMETPE